MNPLLDKFDKEFDALYPSGLVPKNEVIAFADIVFKQAFEAGQQSNLERLIEKCGDKGETINLDIQPDGTTKAENESGNLGFGSTPTEAVENLIKALEKK